jgi:hypothetical protein
MKRLTTLLFAVSLLSSASAWADWKYAKWGAKPDEVAKASGGAVTVLPAAKRVKHAEPYLHSETAATGTYVDGDLTLKLSFSFDAKTGGLTCIAFDLPKKSSMATATKMKDLFVALNGKSLTHNETESVGMETFAWSTPKDQVGVTLMDTADESFATQCSPGNIPPF